MIKQTSPSPQGSTFPSTSQERKYCLRCGKTRQGNEFLTNKGWAQQKCIDLWCKSCLQKCNTKDEFMEYFWQNHREWSQQLWIQSKREAALKAGTNKVFISASDEKRQQILQKIAISQAIKSMNKVAYYKYFDNKGLTYQQAKRQGLIADEDPKEKKQWSDEWCGNFTKRQISWLNDYYNRLSQDGKLQFDATTDDYAHKIAKASLMNNKAEMDFASGRCDFSVVKDTASIFDLYNKSANFAACKRKSDSDTKQLSVGQIVLYLNQHGHPCTKKIEFEEDDVDKCINELRHIVTAVGFDE